MESQNRETIAKKERMGSHLDSNSTEMTMEISSSNMASASRMIAHSQYMSNSESSLTDNNEPSSVSDEKVTVRKTRFCNKESSQKSLSLGDLADNNAQRKGGEHQKRRPQFDDRENSCGSLGSTDETARSGSRPGLRQSRWSSRHSFPKSDSESMLNASQASLMAFFAKPPSLENTESTVSSPFRRFRLFCGTVVEAPIVQVAIIVLIVINALLMGVGTFDFVTEHPNVDRKFNIVDRTFLAIFSVESALQLIYRGVYLFLDGWLVFDFVIVIASWSLESLQIVRAFRIFRAFRLITRIGPLRELIMALGNVMPRLNAIFFMLFLVFYIYAVLFTFLFGDLELSKKYFDTLFHSLFTCFELMTLEWATIAREVMEQKTWAWAPILSYISITGFIVYNLIVAVVCDAVAIVDKQVKAEQEAEDQAERERKGNAEPEEVDIMAEMDDTQIRLFELSNEVEDMKARHKAMSEALATFAADLGKLEIGADSNAEKR